MDKSELLSRVERVVTLTTVCRAKEDHEIFDLVSSLEAAEGASRAGTLLSPLHSFIV